MKRWIPLAAFAVAVVGVGHILVDGDWYAVRKFKQMFSGGELSVAEAQRELDDAKRGVLEAENKLRQARCRFAVAENAPVRVRGRFGGILDPVQTARANVVWNRTGRRPVAPFQIITSPGADYFVKLADAATGREAVAVYVPGGRPAEVMVPLGAYTMRYAYGERWYGELCLFGPDGKTRYSEAARGNTPEIFRFQDAGGSYTGYTVELIRQSGGNLPTKAISAGEF